MAVPTFNQTLRHFYMESLAERTIRSIDSTGDSFPDFLSNYLEWALARTPVSENNVMAKLVLAKERAATLNEAMDSGDKRKALVEAFIYTEEKVFGNLKRVVENTAPTTQLQKVTSHLVNAFRTGRDSFRSTAGNSLTNSSKASDGSF